MNQDAKHVRKSNEQVLPDIIDKSQGLPEAASEEKWRSLSGMNIGKPC